MLLQGFPTSAAIRSVNAISMFLTSSPMAGNAEDSRLDDTGERLLACDVESLGFATDRHPVELSVASAGCQAAGL